jgi:hypothetical protein
MQPYKSNRENYVHNIVEILFLLRIMYIYSSPAGHETVVQIVIIYNATDKMLLKFVYRADLISSFLAFSRFTCFLLLKE